MSVQYRSTILRLGLLGSLLLACCSSYAAALTVTPVKSTQKQQITNGKNVAVSYVFKVHNNLNVPLYLDRLKWSDHKSFPLRHVVYKSAGIPCGVGAKASPIPANKDCYLKFTYTSSKIPGLSQDKILTNNLTVADAVPEDVPGGQVQLTIKPILGSFALQPNAINSKPGVQGDISMTNDGDVAINNLTVTAPSNLNTVTFSNNCSGSSIAPQQTCQLHYNIANNAVTVQSGITISGVSANDKTPIFYELPVSISAGKGNFVFEKDGNMLKHIRILPGSSGSFVLKNTGSGSANNIDLNIPSSIRSYFTSSANCNVTGAAFNLASDAQCTLNYAIPGDLSQPVLTNITVSGTNVVSNNVKLEAYVSDVWRSNQGPLGGAVSAYTSLNGVDYIGTEAGGVYEFDAQKNAWVSINNGIGGKINSLITANSGGGASVIAAQNTINGVKLLTVNDTWTTIGNLDDTPLRLYAYNNTLYVVGTKGIYQTDLSSSSPSWKLLTTTKAGGGTMSFTSAILRVGNDALYAGDVNNGVYKLDLADSNAQWEATTGLSGENVVDLALYANKLYAATSDGVYMTLSSNSSWTPYQSNQASRLADVIQLYFAGDELYALTDTELFTSRVTIQNPTWFNLGGALPGYNFSDPTGRIMWADAMSHVHVALQQGVTLVNFNTNAQKSWARDNINGLFATSINSMQQIGTKVYAATAANGVFVYDQSNPTAGWQSVDKGLNGYGVNDLIVYDGKLYAANDASLSGSGVQFYDGTQWQDEAAMPNFQAINQLFYANGKFYAAPLLTNQAYAFVPGAATSTIENIVDSKGKPITTFVEAFAAFNGKLYMGTTNGLFVFNPTVSQWQQDTQGGISTASNVEAFAVNGNTLYAVGTFMDGAVVRVLTSGETKWQDLSGLPGVGIGQAIIPVQGFMVYSGTNGVAEFKIGDYQDNYVINDGLIDGNQNIESLLLSNNTLYAGSVGSAVSSLNLPLVSTK